MRRSLFACAFLAASSAASAQAPGFVSFSLTGLGTSGGTTGVVGESRLPVRASDVTARDGVVQIVAGSSRSSLRRITLTLSNPVAGERYAVGEGATLTVRFASGNERAPAEGRAWVQVDIADPSRVAGTFEATFPQGRIPIELRGRFDAALR
ncbi:MAG: hypothetical protein R3A48_20305 [Polyangiales bacterium]